MPYAPGDTTWREVVFHASPDVQDCVFEIISVSNKEKSLSIFTNPRRVRRDNALYCKIRDELGFNQSKTDRLYFMLLNALVEFSPLIDYTVKQQITQQFPHVRKFSDKMYSQDESEEAKDFRYVMEWAGINDDEQIEPEEEERMTGQNGDGTHFDLYSTEAKEDIRRRRNGRASGMSSSTRSQSIIPFLLASRMQGLRHFTKAGLTSQPLLQGKSRRPAKGRSSPTPSSPPTPRPKLSFWDWLVHHHPTPEEQQHLRVMYDTAMAPPVEQETISAKHIRMKAKHGLVEAAIRHPGHHPYVRQLGKDRN